MISSDLTHDHHAVAKFNSLLVHHIEKKVPHAYHIQFSDGCSSQYKVKTSFLDMMKNSTAVAANVKSSARLYIKSRQGIIRNANEFYKMMTYRHLSLQGRGCNVQNQAIIEAGLIMMTYHHLSLKKEAKRSP